MTLLTDKNLESHVDEIRENGYTVLPSAFSKTEIDGLRETFLQYFRDGDYINIHGGKSKPDFLKNPQLQNTSWVLANKKVASLLKMALGDQLVFCEHSDAHFNITNHWHKDVESPSLPNPWNDEAHESPYRILKVAIYLQEHASAKNCALKIRKASHNHHSVDEGEVHPIVLELGDVIIFDCRTTHMGQKNPLTRNPVSAYLIKLLRKNKRKEDMIRDFRHLEKPRARQRLVNRVEYLILSWLNKMEGRSDRISLFYTFGAPSLHTELHISSSKTRQDIQNGAVANDEVYEYKSHLDAVDIRY